jgi:hypothetical protein
MVFWGVDWIRLAQDRTRGGFLWTTHTEPSGSIKDGEFLNQRSVLLASQEGLSSMELVMSIARQL